MTTSFNYTPHFIIFPKIPLLTISFPTPSHSMVYRKLRAYGTLFLLSDVYDVHF
jgi:hypothetical protein